MRVRFIAFLLGIAATVACATAPARLPAAAGTLLIGNKGEDTLSFVDLATGRELGRVATGKAPHEIAVSPDGRQAAVVAYGGRATTSTTSPRGAGCAATILRPMTGRTGWPGSATGASSPPPSAAARSLSSTPAGAMRSRPSRRSKAERT